jgi:hypothetical protein
MYNFIRLQYAMGTITEVQLYKLVPKYLTEEQVQMILEKPV